MTELEQQLSKSLSALSTQYAADMTRLAEQNLQLQAQVESLSLQVTGLASRFDEQTKRSEVLTEACKQLARALAEDSK